MPINIQDRVIRIVAAHEMAREKVDIKPDTVLAALDMDSLEMAALVADLETEFSFSISNDTARQWSRVADIVASIRNRLP